MKTRLFFLFATYFFVTYCHAGTIKRFSFQGSVIELLDSAAAAEATNHSDEYTKALTSFDLQIRLGRKENVSEKGYLDLAASQALTWTGEDSRKLETAFGDIETFLKENGIHLHLPEKIQMLKTAGAEEFGAEGYTRENRIMLCVKARQEITTHVVAHELFHVFSRFNAGTRDSIYAIFGFEKCNRVNTATAMGHLVITNPDCPFTAHFITLPWKNSMQPFVLQLYSTKPFDGQFSFENMNVGLLAVAGSNNDMHPSVGADGKPILLQLGEIPELFNKVSRNTPYVLHPEEIAAEHFAMWVVGQKVSQPEYFDKMKTVLVKTK
jgi:hypothetical protein